MATYHLFDHGQTPTFTASDISSSPITLGVFWKTRVPGVITSVWVYVPNTNLNGSAGSALVYTGAPASAAAGTLLSQKDFTFQGTVGWQEVVLDTPVTTTANGSYITAVFFGHAAGHFGYTDNYFTSEISSGVLTTYRGDTTMYDVGNGRWISGSSPAYPQNRAASAANYWIDCTFSTISVATSASSDTVTTGTGTTLTATPSEGTSYGYAWAIVAGSGTFGSASASQTTYTPSTPGKHVLKCVVTAPEGVATGYVTIYGSAPVSSSTGIFNTTITDTLSAQATGNATKNVDRSGVPFLQQRSLYQHRLSFGDAVTNLVPILEAVTGMPTTYVVRTYLLRDCTLTGVRFLKSPAAHGDHVVVIWQLNNQTPLAIKVVPLVADDGGWVEVTLDEPINLTASDTVPYLIGYFTPSGDAMRAQWTYGSQDVVEYPFRVGLNGGGFGQVEGSGWAVGYNITYPTAWQGHSYLIDPIVEWQATDVATYTGGLEYYKRFSAYSTINHFPIGVWLPDPSSIAAFKAIGMNTVIAMGGDVEVAKAAVIAQNIDVFPFVPAGDTATLAQFEADTNFYPHIKGYLIRDEPDMIGPWTSPAELQDWYNEIRRRDSTKMVYFNLGKFIVQNKGFANLPAGASIKQINEYWRDFAHITDIISNDFYMEDASNYEGIYGLWCNPRMIKRLQDLSDHSRPVWHYIATTAKPGTEPAPTLVYRSVWASLIGGARGIVFFDHQFAADGSYITDFAMNNNPAMKAQVQSLITLIQSLSGALLSAEVDLPITVGSSNTTEGPVGGTYGVPIHYTIRQDGGTTYLFTQAIRPGTTTANFTLPAAANKTITVINESRTVSADGSGVFTDSFGSDYEVHLYSWT